MKRRTLLAWSTPVVTAVLLPAHAQTTSDEVGVGVPRSVLVPTTLPPSTTLPPPPSTTLPPDGPCKDGKVLICHKEKDNQHLDLCVAKPAVPAHIKNHGDYLGSCK